MYVHTLYECLENSFGDERRRGRDKKQMKDFSNYEFSAIPPVEEE